MAEFDFAFELNRAAELAYVECKKLQAQMDPEYSGEGERTFVAMLYFHLRQELERVSASAAGEITLEFNRKYPGTGGGFADLTYAKGGVWDEKNREPRVFVEVKPVWDNLASAKRAMIEEDITKLVTMKRRYRSSTAFLLLVLLGRRHESDFSKQSRVNLMDIFDRARKADIVPLLVPSHG